MIKRLSLLVIIAALCFAFSAFAQNGKAVFKHAEHKEDLTCASCHEGIVSDKGIFKMYPPQTLCGKCHEGIGEQGYVIVPPKPGGPAEYGKAKRTVNFLHSDHKDVMDDCELCHQDIDKKPHAAGSHKICGQCHEADIKNMLCAKCHREMAFAGLNKLTSYTHAANFLKEHSDYATRSVRTCTQCHTEAYCNDCHSRKSGRLKPSVKYPEAVRANFIHRGDYLTKHRIEARTDQTGCIKCHARKDCQACHDRYKVSARSDTLHYGHPKGWLSKGSKDFHGDEARRNIISCASCHENNGPGNCISCHKASLGVNPHPPGWSDRVRTQSKSDRMCANCHSK